MIQFIDFVLGEIQKALEAHKREPIKKVPNKIPNIPPRITEIVLIIVPINTYSPD